MTITSRSKKWEILHSLWIGWTFTLGFFNWVAFFYIGLRARQTKWFIYGLIYLIPFVLAVSTPDGAWEGWMGDLIIALTLLMGIASIVQAFWVRKEYLLRLDALKRGTGEREAALKQRIEEERRDSTRDEERAGRTETLASSDPPVSRHGARESLAQDEPVAPEKTHLSTHTTPGASTGGERSQEEYQITRSSLDHRLQDYPFPIAFSFGLLMSKWDPRDRYREQLRFAENILAFLASTSLALLRERGHAGTNIRPEEYWRGGISPGDWKDIIGRCSRVFSEREDHPLARSIQNLNIRSEKRGFGRDIAALITEKNDYKHDRGPTVEEDIIAASNEVQERLDRCTQALAFFTEYPIRLVQDFDVDRSGEEFILKCLRYMGDGPGFHQEKITFDRALPRGDLFMDLGDRHWAQLYPFITTMNCPRCKFREVYSIDWWNEKRGVARLKSFERGHTEESEAISGSLTEWTLEESEEAG